MKIYNYTSTIQFQGLISLKDYKGPLLNLTEADKIKISALKENIAQMEFELYRLNSIYGNKRLRTETLDFYASRVHKLTLRIDELQEMIRSIKIDRLSKQKI